MTVTRRRTMNHPRACQWQLLLVFVTILISVGHAQDENATSVVNGTSIVDNVNGTSIVDEVNGTTTAEQSTNNSEVPEQVLTEDPESPTTALEEGQVQDADDSAPAPVEEPPAGQDPPFERQQQEQQAPLSLEDIDKPGFDYTTYATLVPDPYRGEPAPLPADATKEDRWGFYDDNEERYKEKDFPAAYPNRDFIMDDMPEMAWQNDAVYVNHLIDDADNLLRRTRDAIFEEYGLNYATPDDELALREQQQYERSLLSHWDILDIGTSDLSEALPETWHSKGTHGQGGWSPQKSWNGLVRRLLHAILTNDTFTVVLAGHSAAAGHGNHFHQNYLMQFHQVMAPVFARLGVKLVTHNFSQGGLGTIQNSMAMKDLYGAEIDLLLWDCGMTEGNNADIDYFFRQGLLSGNRVPVIWGGPVEVLEFLYQNVDADVGFFGNGLDGIKTTTSESQAYDELTHSSRFMKCSSDASSLCQENRFCASCWTERPDVDSSQFEEILSKVPSQVRWHPGWRFHRLQGRVLALSLIQALQDAVEIYSQQTSSGATVDEAHWHMTAHYQNIRNKLAALPEDAGFCPGIADRLPGRVCHTVLSGRSLYTPRANPVDTSLLTLIKPAADGYLPSNAKVPIYTGPDVLNECDAVPEGEADPFSVASHRRQLLAPDEKELPTASPQQSRRHALAIETPGRGWQHQEEKAGVCDGSYYNSCGRDAGDECPMLGHHDSRGYVAGNEYSGWLVFDIPKVEEGLIFIKLYTWLKLAANTMTETWTSVNNERRQLLRTGRNITARQLVKAPAPPFPASFEFEYSINGEITTLTGEEAFMARISKVQRVVEVLTILDDPAFGTQENVEVAIRLKGVGTEKVFGVTHLYWA